MPAIAFLLVTGGKRKQTNRENNFILSLHLWILMKMGGTGKYIKDALSNYKVSQTT